MADSCTEGLRREAPHWTLAGDKHLLDVLQGLHQKIIEKCQETNKNLEKMVSALDEASIHLQNVNNKFSALSNNQFVESRVFDDDSEDLPQPEKRENEQDSNSKQDEEANLKRSLRVLEELHESVTILCDSESDSGTDNDDEITRVVLRARDVYRARPLPHVIGSRAWRDKSHAGLLVVDSDSVSSGSGPRVDTEQYSDSEPEPGSESPTRYTKPTHSPSLSSRSSLGGVGGHVGGAGGVGVAGGVPSAAALAAETARRLAAAGAPPRTHTESPEREPSPAARRPLYKPQKPLPGMVFPDEPPPLDSDQSEESDNDIFAELHKKQPSFNEDKDRNSVADDLFGRPVYQEPPTTKPTATQNQPLLKEEYEPELFADTTNTQQGKENTYVKKPVGGKSLFGSNANAESIGAAILKRNQRHSSASDEESGEETTAVQNKHNVPINIPREDRRTEEKEERTQKEKERDIFEDLFAKSERINKEKNKINVTEEKKEIKKPEKKPDLFSDDIFDDIDDIFTSNIKVASKDDKKAQKSIFDDDDDDLFSGVSKSKKDDVPKIEAKSTRDVFDDNSDDGIFSDKPTEYKNKSKDEIKENSSKATKSIFDDSDDDLFSDVDKSKTAKNVTMSVNSTKNETISNLVSGNTAENVEKSLLSGDDDLLKNDSNKSRSENLKEESTEIITNKSKVKLETTVLKPSKVVKSPDLFDDEDDGLFLFQPTQNKPKVKDNSDYESKADLFNNKSAADATLEKKTAEVMKSKDEASSKFSEKSAEDDLISKPEKVKPAESTNLKEAKEVGEPKQINAFGSEDEDNILKKPNQNIDTTVTILKPNISEKPVMADITKINTKVTVKPTSDTESVITQDITTAKGTVIESKITVVPEVDYEDVTASDVISNETQVIVKPDIAEKPDITKTSTHFEEKISDKPNVANILDNMKEVDANKNVTDSIFDDFVTEKQSNEQFKVNTPADAETDVFSDIFSDQPPVFEKPKEPKKSKNVNALFDDDSDDESLFFKKNDVITDERPEGFVSADDRLFGLFRDEPPAIDIDFIQKPNKVDRFPKADNLVKKSQNNELFGQDVNDHSSEEMNESLGESKIGDTSSKTDDKVSNKNKNVDTILKNDDIFAPSYDCTSASGKNNKLFDDSEENSNKEDIFSSVTEDIFKKPSHHENVDIFNTLATDTNEIKKEQENLENQKATQEKSTENIKNIENSTETKKVGKLKPMNFNINVNTLLPGASPKKVLKITDSPDGQVPSKSNDELHTSEANKDIDSEPKIVKSISFDGNPDSPVLDNKLSKERAKIQVKRRPSTRRARREAVKKSGIDFGEDSTDNSSSIDDPPKNKESKSQYEQTSKETIDSPQDVILINENVATDKIAQVKDLSTDKDVAKDTVDKSSKPTSIFDEFDDVKPMDLPITTTKPLKQDEDNPTSEIGIKSDQTKDVKSKVVYILNDEDIFNAQPNETPEVSQPSIKPKENIKNEEIFDDPDDIFKRMTKKEDKKEGITTLGQVYQDTKPKPQKLDFLSDSDDDNLFKTSKPSKEAPPVVKKEVVEEKSSIEVKSVPLKSKTKASLFDDSNDDIFKPKTTLIDNKKEKKASLFGSDSDEELFSGSKKEKEVPIKKVEAKKEETRRVIAKGPLFDDEDDDLFGVPKKKNIEPQLQSSKPTAAKEVAIKQADPVFNDPLSLLGSDEEQD